MSDDFPPLQDALLGGLYRPVLLIVLAWKQDVIFNTWFSAFPRLTT
ncbi:hypothetical protein AWB69_09112 [Caballeronia udeis]|uniref:Uncharacterized protein n=1 Tax=Caballeronia udeis TaxID=1232866 RepID=A0A158JYC7_9BURK|nr:hypothetical protein AWB69_09112 [Caballeronia udeis]